MTTVEAAAEKLAEHYKQWMIGTDQSGFVLPKARFTDSASRSYNLKNARIRKFLQHEKQTFGINLGWTDDAEPETGRKVARWFFARSGPDTGPIKFGETIAIGNGMDPSFIHYEHRTVGINLSWSNTPVFEWKILGGKPGQPVEVHKYWAIFNTKSEGGEVFIFFDRTVGGDIGWPSSKTWGAQLKDLGMDLAESAAKQAGKAAVTALLSGA
ncbi:MAG TPA: hypothetical protein VMU51_12930 [Mycobacteriales bacterium]|nr:hypothetical protein [Mycobacteriales bacterium]